MRSALADVLTRLGSLLFRSRQEHELEEELAFHVDMETERLVREGVSAAEARRRALVALGGVERTKEEVREARGTRRLTDLWQDLRYAGRGILRAPGFTAMAVLILALGVGATTATFSLANWLLIRPVPGVADPDDLVLVHFEEAPNDWTGLSFLNFMDLREEVDAFASFAGYTYAGLEGGVAGAPAATIRGAAVVGDYFGTLGVRPRLGRFFSAEELAGRADPRVAVISSRLWSSLFSRSENVLGQELRLNGWQFTVVGVAPEEFGGAERLETTDIWLPPGAYALVRHMPDWLALTERRPGMFFEFIGRLAPGATAAQAQAQLRSVMDRLIAEYPEANELYKEKRPTVYGGVGLGPYSRSYLQRPVILLLGISALVLLVAAANLANLLSLRAVRRRGAAAVRRALGASRLRLIQHHATEGVLIGLAGGAAALAVVAAAARMVEGFALFGVSLEDFSLDWRVLLFAAAGGVLVSGLFAVVPTLVAERLDLVANLKEATRTESARIGRARGGLVVVQVAVSIALFIGAMLLVRTLANLHAVDPGFEAARVVAFGFDPEKQGYEEAELRSVRARVLDAARATPGLGRSALASAAPFGGGYFGDAVSAAPSDSAARLRANGFWVSDAYFSTLGIEMVAGRDFRADEYARGWEGAAEPVIVSRAAAEKLFGTAAAVGRQLFRRSMDGYASSFVVGVVEDVRIRSLREDPEPTIYRPLGSHPFGGTYLVVRSDAPVPVTRSQARAALDRVDPGMAFFRAETLSEGVLEAIGEERLFARLVALLAVLAAVLAGAGLYAVIGYSVAQRGREIGVRMALGAGRGNILALVLRQTLGLTALGAAFGVGCGLALAGVLRSRLFGVAAVDPGVLALATAAFLIVALAASAVPARTASATEPSVALRQE